MIRTILLIAMVLALVLTAPHVIEWQKAAPFWSSLNPTLGFLMQVGPGLWMVGLILTLGLAKVTWRAFRLRQSVRTAADQAAKAQLAPAGADTRYLVENHLRKAASDKTSLSLMAGAVFGLMVGAGVGLSIHWGAGLIAGVFVLLMAAQMGAGNIESAGAAGEDLVTEVAKKLPAGYTLFNQLHIPREDRKPIEVDLIVVGPTSLHVIEVKHNRGAVDIDPEAQEWVVHKTGQRGGKYQSSMRNPIRQVRGQVDAVARYLKSQGVRQWATGVVVLSHPEAAFESAVHKDVGVLAPEDLIRHIQETPAKGRPANPLKVVEALARLRGTDSDAVPPAPPPSPGSSPRTDQLPPSRVQDATSAKFTGQATNQNNSSHTSATRETRFWPVGFLLVLMVAPWVVPELSDGRPLRALGFDLPRGSAWSAALIVVLSSLFLYRLNRCKDWLWSAGALACAHILWASTLSSYDDLSYRIMQWTMTVLYPVACGALQFFRFEYAFGIPMVAYQRFDLEMVRPAEYTTEMERAWWREDAMDYEFTEWDFETVETRPAEYEVVGEHVGRKGDAYSDRPAVLTTSRASWAQTAWGSLFLLAGVAILIPSLIWIEAHVCYLLNWSCYVPWRWGAKFPAAHTFLSGVLLIAASVLIRSQRRD